MTSSTRREWGWLFREGLPYARYQILSLVCISIGGVAGLVQPLLMKWLIDEVLPHRRWGTLALITGLFLVAAVGKSALTALSTFVNMLGVKRMTFRTHLRLVRLVQSRSADFHATHPVGDLLQRLERDIALIADFASDAAPAIVRTFVASGMVIGAMLYLDWRLACSTLPVLPLYAYVRHRYRTILQRWATVVREASGRQSSLLQEMLAGAVQIQLLGAERRLAREYMRVGLTTLSQEIRQKRHERAYSVLSGSLVALATALIIGYGGVRVLTGDLTAGGLVAFYGYIGSMFAPMNSLTGLFARVVRTQASIRRLMDLEQVTDAIQDAPDAMPLAAAPRTIAWERISFAYAGQTPVLREVDLDVRVGERLAIVGESGSGKSSLLKLAVRLHEAIDGQLTIDGRDIRSITLDSLRRAISVVPQDPMLFQASLRENLRYGCPSATQDEIEQAGWIACLTEVVERLPQGWDTVLGRQGAGLSGGERQRVAIARAVLQRRPILILDEAFSAVDSAVEHKILARLAPWAAGRIILVVSHRLAAAQWADRVVVIRQGRVVEQASHEALARDGTYYQALWQVEEPETSSTAARPR